MFIASSSDVVYTQKRITRYLMSSKYKSKICPVCNKLIFLIEIFIDYLPCLFYYADSGLLGKRNNNVSLFRSQNLSTRTD